MNRVKRCAGLTVVVLVVLMTGCGGGKKSTPTVSTCNGQAAWHLQFLTNRITALQPSPGGFTMTGRVFDTPEPQTKLLPVGYTFSFGDEHGWKKYIVNSTCDAGLEIHYLSLFDHRSFGKNLIETDSGEFLLEWIPPNAEADAALKAARAFVAKSHPESTDACQSPPACIEKYTEDDRKGWWVKWAPEVVEPHKGHGGGFMAVLGGAFNVIVWDTGECEVRGGR